MIAGYRETDITGELAVHKYGFDACVLPEVIRDTRKYDKQ